MLCDRNAQFNFFFFGKSEQDSLKDKAIENYKIPMIGKKIEKFVRRGTRTHVVVQCSPACILLCMAHSATKRESVNKYFLSCLC